MGLGWADVDVGQVSVSYKSVSTPFRFKGEEEARGVVNRDGASSPLNLEFDVRIYVFPFLKKMFNIKVDIIL